jgi:hypothetical protein
VDKKPQVEILAGQENFVFFTMNADDFIMPDRADGGSNQAKSIGTGDPSPTLPVIMNTSTVFSAIPGWADGFLYQWYYETGSGSGTPVGPGGSFSGPGTRSLSCTVNNSSEGTFRYYVEITNNYTYTSPEGGAVTTGSATRNIYVADIEVVTSSPKSYAVGDPGPGGGIIYYVDPAGFTSNGATCHYLEVGLTNLGPAEWGADGATVAGTTVNIGRGYTNTQTIITALNSLSETGMAAQRARAYTGGGLNDWFLPSQEELILLYKSTLPSLVSGLPPSAWSSTQDSAANAWSVYSGGLASDPKYALLEFRPVRAF